MTLPTSVRFNLVVATLAKVVSICVAIFTVPLLLGLLDRHAYGTWVTLTSMVAFIGLLDLGIGNSLRNTIAAAGQNIGADVHTEFVAAFRLLGGVGLTAIVLLVTAAGLPTVFSDHALEAVLLYAPPILCLPLLLGNSVLQGARATGLQAVLNMAGSFGFFALVGVFALTHHKPSLVSLAIAWSFFYVLALTVTFALAMRVLHLPAKCLFYRTGERPPRVRVFVGLEFLVLQLASLALFNLGNILIFSKLGAEEVARYDVLNKIFQVALSFFMIAIGVMWSEISRYRAESNEPALWRVFRQLGLAAVFFTILVLAGAWLTPWVIDRWTGHRISVSITETYAVALLVSLQALAYVGAVFMNAFERVRPQIAVAVLSMILIFPVSSSLMDRGIGIASIPLTVGVLTLLAVLLCNVYAVQLIRGVGRSVAK